MPSRIVPSLFGALVAAVSGPSDGPAHTHLPAGHPVAFALYPEATLAQQAGSASPALLQAAADGWAWHAVPSFNLFLALVVFLFLIEDRCGQEIAVWVDELTGGRYSCAAGAAQQPDLAPAEKHDPHDAAAARSWHLACTRGMGPAERTALAGATVAVMLSMLFFSNDVFDAYAASVGRCRPLAHAADELLDVAARFSSFSILVVFLLLSLLLLLLAPAPRTTLPPVLFLLAPVLLSSTLVSRFSLGLRTAVAHAAPAAGMTPAHWALLVGEPLVLVAVQAWMMLGAGGQRAGANEAGTDEERVVGVARAGVDDKAPVVFFVVSQHA